MRRALLSLLAVLLAGAALVQAHAEERETTIEKDFRKIERRLDGSDAAIRDACPRLSISIEDVPSDSAAGVVERRSDVALTGPNAEAFRDCVRAIAHAGVIEGWHVEPVAASSTARGFTLTSRLLRVRRDPNVSTGWRTTEESQHAAADRMTAIWKSRKPRLEALGPEILAPDLLELHSARWNAGRVEVEAVADDERFVEGYKALLAPLVTSTDAVTAKAIHVEYSIDVVRPDDAARFALPPLGMPKDGALRAALRRAPPGAILRVLAELDKRDFVIPSNGAPRDGSIAGGWTGIAKKYADDMGRTDVHVGAIDVFAPRGTAEPRDVPRTGRRLDLDLEDVEPRAIASLFAVAGDVVIEVPDGLPGLDVHLRQVPWEQALAAVALASGCTVTAADARHRSLSCSHPASAVPARPERTADDRPPLEREPASSLRVCVLATRDGKRFVGSVATRTGLHVTVRSGVRIGEDGGHAVVDAQGVSLAMIRRDADGTAITSVMHLVF